MDERFSVLVVRVGVVVGEADGLSLGVSLASDGDAELVAEVGDAGLLGAAVGFGDGCRLAVAAGDGLAVGRVDDGLAVGRVDDGSAVGRFDDGLAVGRVDDGLASGVWLAEFVGVGDGDGAGPVARVEGASESCPGEGVEAALVALGAGVGSA